LDSPRDSGQTTSTGSKAEPDGHYYHPAHVGRARLIRTIAALGIFLEKISIALV
jgi:hypothetical protein